MEKRCPHCERTLDESNFNWKIKGIWLAAYCKECSREYIRDHYKRNTEYYLDKARKRNGIIQQRRREYIGSYLKSHPCVDCGEKDILVLEFDHMDRSQKSDEVSHFLQRRISLGILVKEIAKCEVRCANCHRRKTAKESKSWKV